MLNEATAKTIAAEVCQDLGVEEPLAQEAWVKVISRIYAGIVAHAVVSGVCPPNGGPITEGKLT